MSEISPRAEISPKARIGNNCKIFPFVYIEDDVVIGDDCIIFPFVSILDGTRMGSHNKVHQGSVIGALPQDFDFRGEKSECIIGNNNIIRENVVINRATHTGGQTVLGNDNVLMEGAHISHDTKATAASSATARRLPATASSRMASSSAPPSSRTPRPV